MFLHCVYYVVYDNQTNSKELLPVAACAFIRHAFNCFYHDFANVDKGHAFVRERVYYDALISIRSAVLRHTHRMRLLYVHRVRTSVPRHQKEDADSSAFARSLIVHTPALHAPQEDPGRDSYHNRCWIDRQPAFFFIECGRLNQI